MTPAQPIAAVGEHALIARIRARLPAPPPFVRVGIGDDAAVVAAERNASEVLTTDTLVDTVHFDRALVTPRAIGHKALAVNLSDLAAMGATPRLALLSLGLPDGLLLEEFDAVIDGFAGLAARYGVAVVGGNITRTPGPMFVDVTVSGSVRPRRVLLRSTARAGDELFVSGTIGAAVAGLTCLRRPPDPAALPAESVEDAIARYCAPEPRVRLGGIAGRARAASACVDLSDGLADAVRLLAEGSGLGAEIAAESLPWHAAVPAVDEDVTEARRQALAASDDYELLFAVPRRRTRAFLAAARHAKTAVTRIGVCRREAGIVLMEGGAERPWPAGYVHFTGRRPENGVRPQLPRPASG